MLKIRRFHDRLIFNMGIPIPGKDGLDIETGALNICNGSAFVVKYRYTGRFYILIIANHDSTMDL